MTLTFGLQVVSRLVERHHGVPLGDRSQHAFPAEMMTADPDVLCEIGLAARKPCDSSSAC